MTTTEKAKQLIQLAEMATRGPWDFWVPHECETTQGYLFSKGNDSKYITTADPTTVKEICERLIELENNYAQYQQFLDSTIRLSDQNEKRIQTRIKKLEEALERIKNELGPNPPMFATTRDHYYQNASTKISNALREIDELESNGYNAQRATKE